MHGQWDPKRQRPELWNIYNGHTRPGECIRVFPLSNWTELDVWLYIRREQIPIIPLYFAKKRLAVRRNGAIILVNNNTPVFPHEKPEEIMCRFRSLGCVPCSSAIESTAATLNDIISELITSRQSERAGRLIDYDTEASMEKKKQEGYF